MSASEDGTAPATVSIEAYAPRECIINVGLWLAIKRKAAPDRGVQWLGRQEERAMILGCGDRERWC